jgi:helicase
VKLKDVLEQYDYPQSAQDIILASGIESLYPPQAKAIEKGVLEGKNLLLSVPTAAGKTLIAELCMLKSILHHNGRCLYIAPLKALASEKYHDFKNKYEALGIQVGIAIGDYDSPSHLLNRYQILIATAEKVDSLLRTKAKWLIESLNVVVLDEIHFINDGERGPTMEILTARMKQLNPNIRFLALSATVKNAHEMASWLDAELVLDTWRPIPLKEGVYFNKKIMFQDSPTRMIAEDAADEVSNLCLDTLKGKGQVLVFVNSRRSTQAASRQVCEVVAKILKPEERIQLQALSKKIAGGSMDQTKICRKLADTIVHGVAFHHAGLKPNQRELIEQNFKQNLIKVICCTPTLAAGVNLPARRAVIRDCKRFESGLGQAYIPTSEYKQCAGRAGRPQYDDYGEAILIAKTPSEASLLFERYIQADPEPVISKLGSERALRMHVLSSIAGGYVHDVKGMFDFISHTFLYHQKKSLNLLDLISRIFEFLQKENFIEKSGYRFFATAFGSLTSRLYIDPLTSLTLRDGIQKISERQTLNPIGFLHLITSCPDATLLNLSKNDMEDLEKFISHNEEAFILTPDNHTSFEDIYAYLSTVKTAWLLLQWIEEEKEDIMCDQFGIGPGDIYRHVESTQWLLYATSCIADLLQKKRLTFFLEDLRSRVRYGIKEELLEITQLKNIGRIRARQLFHHNFRRIEDLKNTNVDQLASIPHIGRTIAGEILNQIKDFVHTSPRPKSRTAMQ